VPDLPFVVGGELGGGGPDLDHRDTDLLLVLREDGSGGGQGARTRAWTRYPALVTAFRRFVEPAAAAVTR
jgi:hypothetical protein